MVVMRGQSPAKARPRSTGCVPTSKGVGKERLADSPIQVLHKQ